ncbi:TetR/AcrR family transcriptional regulator [Streptomyces sp. A7024]|uniref:TetR/AcrR family transcriptional regulator n=1 Tax=Streptomyces coryli TaxID=1128680 RepID=A0A6G4UAR6_9ACTN|nr:TetR family transcriptional regulator [Streptomyces coryli]NGN68478.1 TetR/AcrR family transcriptional regulator [Streptomyces coryli]
MPPQSEPVASTALTPERILEATEEVLRRYGPNKATVVDVARALGVSHGSVYRHFASKAALREAVTKRWLDRTANQLESIVTADAPAPERLRDWLAGLFAAKRRKAGDDPELFATYSALIERLGGGSGLESVVNRHLADLTGQLTRIIESGIRQGTLAAPDPAAAAEAVFSATARFHDPVYAPEWSHPDIEASFTALVDLLLRGLRP